ncbi:DUF6515 family protein [Aurantibacter sp.]|uniref:DUF6515 family protein n=1 Tax=Aurantibacter sp. TaxID=2807103 RepID=UPI0035C86B58
MRIFLIVFIGSFIFCATSCAPRVVSSPNSKVVYVQKRPANYKVVRVNGKRYYRWNGKNYRKTNKGYALVR